MDERLMAAKTVVFDIGNVLLRFDPKTVCERIPEDKREKLYQAMFAPDGLWPEFDIALESNESIARRIAARAGNEAWRTDVMDAFLNFHLTMYPLPLYGEIRALKEMGKKVYALTNYGEPAFSLARERFDQLQAMDGAVVSAREKVVKPDPEIFERLITRYGLTPGETLFIDDSEKNIAAAEKLGFRVWLYKTPDA